MTRISAIIGFVSTILSVSFLFVQRIETVLLFPEQNHATWYYYRPESLTLSWFSHERRL